MIRLSLLASCMLCLASCGSPECRVDLSGLWQSDVAMTLENNRSLSDKERMLVNKEFGNLFYYFNNDQLQIVYLPKADAGEVLESLEQPGNIVLQEGGFIDSYDYELGRVSDREYRLYVKDGLFSSKESTVFLDHSNECFHRQGSGSEEEIKEYFCKVRDRVE